MYTFSEFEEIIVKLRAEDGCPWDREQTHASLRGCMIEEAYEVAEGIDQFEKTGEYANLREELGDVLLQVVMHSRIAEEAGEFTMTDVITEVAEKMIRRHPHVFGTEQADTSEAVLNNWEEIKRKEHSESTVSESMERIARALPAGIRAEKVQKKAAKVGFDFADRNQVMEKVEEELEELRNAMKNGNQEEIEEEFGDFLFSAVNLSRFLGVNAENSLTNATNKFISRFRNVEITAVDKGIEWKDMDIDQMNHFWDLAKR